ncbi:hypothetical protein FHY30_003230 [Xanthomonas arboricola]|uniref:DUF6932 family protein n=1 Tax=Xanthomonas campestris TaxID=339 RepID=UPI0023EA2870|nr:hypothetical protein [Xanthomonas campestris]
MDMESLLALNTPAFTTSVAECSPGNSSPHVIGWQEFCGTELTARREELRSALSRMLDALPGHGIAIPIIMIGGSFLRGGNTHQPQDMDAVVFYETLTDERPVALSDLQRQLREQSELDIRFMPLDLPAIDVIKLAAYFATLFAASKDRALVPNGVLLLDMER